MPSASWAESLVGIQEVRDGVKGTAVHLDGSEAHFGHAMKFRSELVQRFPPLGPPDMLYTRKKYVPVVGSSRIYGYYHFVRGIEVSSVASITAYIVDVVRNNGLDPAPWATAGFYEVSSASFTAYNMISKADLLVHVSFPGSTTAKATDGNDNIVALDDEFWNEVLVSSFVRDILSHGEQPQYPSLRVLDFSLRSEAVFLDAAAACVHKWYLAGTDDVAGVAGDASKSRIARAIKHHFLSCGRYEACIDFFLRERIQEVDIQCLVYAAAAARMKGDLDAAHKIVDDVMGEVPESDLAWMERARIFRAEGSLAKALEAAKTASSHAEDEIYAWLLLADLYVDDRQYGNAFEALNATDLSPASLDPFLRELVPNRKNTTVPVEGFSKGTDTIRVLTKKLREEKNMQIKTDTSLSYLPGRLMSETEYDCYAVLVKILTDLSWDEMLAVRGKCFVMETDVDSGILEKDGRNENAEERNGTENAGDSQPVGDDNSEQAEEEDGEDPDDDAANGISTISLDNDDYVSRDDGQNSTGASPAELRRRTFEKTGKKVCKPWLDYLVQNMYEDLRAMALWNGEEQQHSSADALASAVVARRSDSENVGGNEDHANETSDMEASRGTASLWRTSEDVLKTTKRPVADWLHRGELALRLAKREEAKTAFEVCIKLFQKEKGTSVTALNRLVKMAAADGDTRTAVKCADAIWTYMDSNTDRKQSSEPTPPVPEVRKAIFNLISKSGLRAVRDVVTQELVDRKRMESLLLDSVALRVDGFSQ